ncbi:MAG: DUF4062 domain-containing protein [Armatimonadota bacterium]
MSITRRIFLSSTVYDLGEERQAIKAYLERHRGLVRFTIYASEEPTFPVNPDDLGRKHSYQICIDKVADCDYMLLLIKQRYGAPLIEDHGEKISITHREYREAYRRQMPIFTFVDQRTWDARKRFKAGESQSFIPQQHVGLFHFLDEIVHQQRNWMFIHTGIPQMRTVLRSSLFRFDDSSFVADVTVPDGTIIRVNEEFTKIWEIRNTGCVAWEGRTLIEENTGVSGLVPSERRVALATTLPGETLNISVRFIAPKYPCSCESYWKMIDASGRYCYPRKKGLFCRVKVIY